MPSPTHWTYCEVNSEEDLAQGDIISRTDEMIEILNDVFPLFADEKYTAFVVLTQSCDLVRRSQQSCKAQYITLSVVREFEQFLPRLMDEMCGCEVNGVYLLDKKSMLEETIRRIVNQNDQSRGLFYLHEDGDAGIAAHSVAMLRITFSLRQSHYEAIQNSRCGRIDPLFAGKLGWLTGNLFSRVATPDWEEKSNNKNAGVDLAASILSPVVETHSQRWVRESWIEEANRKQVDFSKLEADSFRSELEKYAPLSPVDVVRKRVSELVRTVYSKEFALNVTASLSSDDVFFVQLVGCLKAKLLSLVNNDPSVADRIDLLKDDSEFRKTIQNFLVDQITIFLGASSDSGSSFIEFIRELSGSGGLCRRDLWISVVKVIDPEKAIAGLRQNQLRQSDLFGEVVVNFLEDSIGEAISKLDLSWIEKIDGRLMNDGTLKGVLQKS